MSTYWCPRCGHEVGMMGHAVSPKWTSKSPFPVYDIEEDGWGWGWSCQKSPAGDEAMKIIEEHQDDEDFDDYEVEEEISQIRDIGR